MDLNHSIANVLQNGIEQINEQCLMMVKEMVKTQIADYKRQTEIVTTTELAKYLNCHRNTINNYVKNSPGFPVFYVGDRPRFKKQEVIDWLSQNATNKFTNKLDLVNSQKELMKSA